MAVTTAVIPAAGWGTRFLPATKAVPKELLPVVDRPMIQYAAEEACAAGIDELVVVTSEGKDAIGRHLEPYPELEAVLEASGKAALLAAVRDVCPARVGYAVQEEQLGLGHAVGCARGAVGERPFAVLLPDEIITSGLLARMIGVFEEHGGASVIGLMEVPREEISAYGCAEVEGMDEAGGVVRVRSVVEKPAPAKAPSPLALIGRYVFGPEVFDAIEGLEPGAGGELQLTDAIDVLAGKGDVFGVVLTEGRYDVGRKEDFLRATVELALERDDLGAEFGAVLAEIVRRRGLV